MKSVILCLVSLFCTSVTVSAGEKLEGVFLQEGKPPKGQTEGILLYIAANGHLASGTGPKTDEEFQTIFKDWRSHRTEPFVRVILYPSLESNSNLKMIRRIIDFLHANHVGYDILLEPPDAKPEKELL